MITCPQCGFQNPVNYRFCQNCGSGLEVDKSEFEVANQEAVEMEVIEPTPLALGHESMNAELQPIPVPSSQPLGKSDLDKSDPAEVDIDPQVDPQNGELENAPWDDLEEAPKDVCEVDGISNEIPIDIPEDLVDQVSQITEIPADLAIPLEISEAEFQDLQILEAEAPEDITHVISNKTEPIQELKSPLLLTHLNYAGLTDVGQERDHNEDNFIMLSQLFTTENAAHEVIQDQRGLFVLCDGMGGHAGGEVASAIAIKEIVEQSQFFWANGLPGEQQLEEIIHSANQAIFCLNDQQLRRDLGRMGTTVVVVAIHNTEVAIAHVGDSRIYRITASKLEQITRDHEVANRLIDQGMSAAAALARPDAHQLTQALGPFDNLQVFPTVQYFQITEPTLFLLCSDGLCDDNLVEENWETHLLPLLNSGVNLRAGVQDLIYLANYLNGHDNITAITVQCLVSS